MLKKMLQREGENFRGRTEKSVNMKKPDVLERLAK